jgi:hypothetical protein
MDSDGSIEFRLYHRVHIGWRRSKEGAPALSAGEYTTTLNVMVDIVKGGGRKPPPPTLIVKCTPENGKWPMPLCVHRVLCGLYSEPVLRLP